MGTASKLAALARSIFIGANDAVGVGAAPGAWTTYKVIQLSDFSLAGNATYSIFGRNWRYDGTDRYLNNGPASMYFQGGGDHNWRVAPSGTAGNPITFVDAMRIDSSGNLMVGTSTAGGKFRVAQAANDIAFRLDMSNAGFTNQIMYVTCNTAEGTGYTVMTYRNENAARDDFIIFGNGNVQNRNNSYAGISDIKLKENIVDATPKLADLMQVKVRTYNLIGDTQKQIGVVAQELEEVFPSLVEESPDREMRKTVDEDGNETESMFDLGTTTKSVKYSVFVPMLIKAIQEQQALITTLTERVAVLESTP